jgi:unsaturated rhamnogalacturonyl hydrolase
MQGMLSTNRHFCKIVIVTLLFCNCKAIGQSLILKNQKWSERTAISILKSYPKAWQIDGNDKPKWDYKLGFVLQAFERLYQKTNDTIYFNYIREYAEEIIDSSGTIRTYNNKEYNIDFINPGKVLFDLYKLTNDERYLTALMHLRSQLEQQPRTESGGFWHKEIYPNQMWLDGLYMGEPFYARYTVEYENGKYLNDVAKQFEIIHKNIVDKKTGLLFHAWDESKQIAWADPLTGTSPTIWSRGIGWYMMALVDVLDYYPDKHPKKKVLKGYLNEMAATLLQYKTATDLWCQITDKTLLKGNYLEPSASAMFIYAFAKGSNQGYLPGKFKKQAQKSFSSFIAEFIKINDNGTVNIVNVSPNVGLGGTPFRDGSNAYYLKGKSKDSSSAALAAFILSAIALDK